MRGDSIVQSQLLVAQSLFALAEHINQSTGFQLTPIVYADRPTSAKMGALACFTDSMTYVPGDIVVGGGTHTVLAISDGTNWIVAVGHAKRGIFNVRLGANQVVANGVFTLVNLTVVDVDPDGWWNASLKRYVPQVAGFYQFNATCGGTGSTASGVSIVRNGIGAGTDSLNSVVAYTGGKIGSIMSVSAMVNLNGTTDYIEVYGAVEETPTPTITAATLSGARVG